MATEHVIELGSSDEESEPAPKKANAVKRRPNAMVQIPSGVTIKPATKSANRNINPIKELIGKGLTVTKVNKSSPGQSSSLRNGKPTSKPIRMPQMPHLKSPGLIQVQSGIQVRSMPLVNPLNMIKKLNKSVTVRPPNPTSLNLPVQNAKSFNKLPTSLTITKKSGPGIGIKVGAGLKSMGNKLPLAITGAKRPASTITSNVKKKRKITPEQQMLTVDLDDEEPTTSTASPQWYIRPEDTILPDVIEKEKYNDEPSMEAQNNAEPQKLLEITIEDSPIKPAHNKHTHVIGAELAITIDDSPIKAVAITAGISADSDSEQAGLAPKERQSKKKLNYPNEVDIEKQQENIIEKTTIEIELEPFDTEVDIENNDNSNNDETNKEIDEEVIIKEEVIVNKELKAVKQNEKVIINDSIIEIFESPAKAAETLLITPKKVTSETRKVKPIAITSEFSQTSEFHPVYQEFIDLCFKLENSNDMKTIVEKKIKGYYRQVPKEYTESEEFVELVQSKLLSMRAGPEKLYLYIKDIVDELNLQRKLAKAKPTVIETSNLEAEKFQYGEDSEFDLKRQRQIRKLEKTLKKLHRAIQKLEEQEVDFDDEEDSVYLLTESDDSSSSIKDLDRQLERERSVLLKRYKERMVRVHAKFCQLTNTKMPSEPRIQIQQRPGQPAGPAKRLEKWVNKKVPIGKPLPFPDFHDVLRCVRDANDEDKLGLNEAEIMEEARDLFTRCGKKLQRRRQENEWRLAASRISVEVDPAENSYELKKKLDTNKQMAAKKETEVFNKYADKQSQLKLEAVEIGDKEAEESPVESEDEEPQDESSKLENKEKRKERLRRLISEKSKKTESKEIEPKDASPSEEKVGDDDNAQKDIEMVENVEMEVDLVPEEGNKDNEAASLVQENVNDEQGIFKETVHSISGDSKLDSDVDELHLLQKLHSDEVNTSAIDTTDSESPIDISDTLTSSDNKKPSNSDNVISIENSSYSETEAKEDLIGQETESENNAVQEIEKVEIVTSKIMPQNFECLEEHAFTTQKNKTNNQEYNESVESILLATTDEETDDREKDESPRNNEDCVNLKDDAISIGETVIENGDNNKANTVSSNDEISCRQIENNKFSDENFLESVMLRTNYKNSEVLKETSRKSVQIITEEKNVPLLEEQNVDNSAIASNKDAIDEIHSIESVESDNSQNMVKTNKLSEVQNKHSDLIVESKKEVGTLTIEAIESDNSQENSNEKEERQQSELTDNLSVETLGSDNSQDAVKVIEDIEMIDEQQSDKNPSVETLGSEISQEAAKEIEDIVMTDKQQSDKIKNPSVETLESDNSQERTIRDEDIIMREERLSDEKQNPSVETLDSDNSQEAAKTPACEESTEQLAQVKDRITENNSLEVHELTDSNSPNQIENVSSNNKIREDMNTLESIIEDLQSDIGLNKNLVTATGNNE